MKRKMKVIVSMALAASMTLVNSFTAITTFAQTSTVQSTSELIAKEAGALRMGLFGDSHILRWNNGDGNYSANAMVKAVNKVLQTFNTQQVDGLALTGDNVYQLDSSYGNSDKDDLSYVPYNYLKKSLNENGGWWTYPEGETFDITQDVNHGGKLSDNVVYTMGNHEFSQNDNTAEGAQATREIFETAMGIKPEDDRKIGGYHFITAAGNDYNSNMTTEVQKGVIEKIDAAHEEDATKPVFVLIHHPIHETICGSNSAANSKYNSDDESFDFKTELNKRPYVIVFCAHTHYAAQNLRSIWQDGFTVVHTPLVSGSNMSAESSDLSMLGQTSIQVSQGMMMDVKDGVVTIYRLDFDNGEFIGEPYVIDINKGVDGFKYKNRTPGNPYFENGASITVNEIESTSVTISFPAAAAPVENGENEGYVSKYKVTATDSAGATITKTFLSDFWKSPSKRASSFTATLSGLEAKTAYTLTVTPITTLGGTGTPLSVDITSAGIKPDELTEEELAKEVPAADWLDVDFSSGSPDDLTKTSNATTSADAMDGVPRKWGAPAIKTSTAGVNYAYFDGTDDAYSYFKGQDEYAKAKKAITLEAMVCINKKPSGTKFILGGQEGGGAALRYSASGNVGFSVYIGGDYRVVQAALPTGKWAHVVGTYDGSYIKLFIDGVNVVTEEQTGSIAWPGTSIKPEACWAMVIGADTGRNSAQDAIVAQEFLNASVLNARVYTQALSIGPINKLCNESNGILANLPDSMSFTSADMLDTSTATVNEDGTITIAQNQTARFARTIGSNAQYTVKISSGSAMNSAAATLNVTRKGNTDTDNTDVAKIWKKSVAADATSATLGYIGFIQGYNEIGITNTSANDITISAVDLSKKTYTGEEKLIEIPMFNYNPGGKNVGYYTWITSQASNYRQYGEYMSVYNDVAKAVIREGEWFKYDVELNQAQEYYVVVNDGVEKNANARYVLEINDEYKLDKTVPQTATTSNYVDTYRLLGKIKLNKGVNTIKLSAKQTQEYYGMLLIKADTVINLTPDSMNINANSAQILKRAGYSLGSGVSEDETGYSLPNSTRLGYIVYVQSPGTYKLDYTGANKTTNEKFYTYFDNAVMKTTALAYDSPNYSTIKVLGTAEDIFLSSGIHFIELNRSGNLQTGTTYSGTWGQYVFRQMQFAKTADYTPEGAYEFKVKATDFNRYAGEGTGFKSVGTYDNSNNIYDEWYKPIRATSTGIVGIYNGEWLAYDIYAPKAGYYTVTASAGVDTGNMQFTVSTENSSITSPLCAATGSWSTYSNFDLGQIYLEEGYNLVKVANTGTTCNLQSVSFTVPTMAFYDTAGEKITSFVNSSELTGKAETGDIVNAVLLMADYDESGRLISVNNVSKAEAESLQTKITTDSRTKEVKLFIFDNIQNIIPLAGYESIGLEQ